jgi:hypothetical protein
MHRPVRRQSLLPTLSVSLASGVAFALAACSGGAGAGAPAPPPPPDETAPPAPSTAPTTSASASGPNTPPPPTRTSFVVDGQAPCQITQVVGRLASTTLSYRGVPFAVRHGASQAHLSVGAAGARLRLEDDDLELTGEVEPTQLRGVPLDENTLAGGYLRLLEAPVVEVKGAEAVLGARGVSFLRPKAPLPLKLACDKIALGSRAPSGEAGKLVGLRAGLQEPFALTKGGDAVATLVTPKPVPPRKMRKQEGKMSPLDRLAASGVLAIMLEPVVELERDDHSVRIRIAGFTEEATGWVPLSAVKTSEGEGGGSGFGGLGSGRGSPRRLKCGHPVPIYVRAGDEVVRVGQYKTGGPITPATPTDEAGGKADEVVVVLRQSGFFGLGGGGRKESGPGDAPVVTPFVQRALLTDCEAERGATH